MNLQALKFRKHNDPLQSKSHKKIWIIATILTIIILFPVLVLGWMGLVPGISNVMGSANPRDLGVRYSQTDLDNYNQKAKVQFLAHNLAPADPKNPNQKTYITNPTSVSKLGLTQEEISSAINSNSFSWMPVENSQVKITNGVLEISGSLNVDKLEDFRSYISDGKQVDQDLDSAITWAKRFRNDVPVYAKASANIVNNKLTFKLLDAEIGRFNIPLGDLGQELSSGNTSAQINSEYFSANYATLVDGRLDFSGVYPAVIYVKP